MKKISGLLKYTIKKSTGVINVKEGRLKAAKYSKKQNQHYE